MTKTDNYEFITDLAIANYYNILPNKDERPGDYIDLIVELKLLRLIRNVFSILFAIDARKMMQSHFYQDINILTIRIDIGTFRKLVIIRDLNIVRSFSHSVC